MIAFIVSIAVRVFYSIRALNLFTFNAHKIRTFVCAVSFCVDFLDYFDVPCPSVRFFDVIFFLQYFGFPYKLFIRFIELLIEIYYATDQKKFLI